MQHLKYSTLETAARFLSAKSNDEWTPELILDRLRILLNNHCEGLGLETVRVLLPAGWQVQDALTSELIRLSRPTMVEVSQAADFVDQLCTFGDSATAVGRPLAVTMGTRRLHSMDLIPASALRLVPGDLAALADLPKPETITPYLDLVAGIQDGLYSAPFEDDEADVDDEPHWSPTGPETDAACCDPHDENPVTPPRQAPQPANANSSPVDSIEKLPDLNGLVAWQRALLECWQQISTANQGKPNARDAMSWLKKNGPPDVIPKEQPKTESMEWIGLDGAIHTVRLKTVQNVITTWKKTGKLPA